MLIKLLLLLVGVALLWAAVGSSRVVRQPRYAPDVTPDDVGLAWQGLSLKTRDGILISGWLIRHPAPQGVLLLLHGFGTSKADLLDIAQAFYPLLSCHLLMIDFRGHGASGGDTLSFGRKEMQDIKAALDFLSAETTFRELPVGLFGISMGGSIGLMAAASFPQIRAVMTDSAYADLGCAIARAQWLAYHIPRIPLGQLVIWGSEIRLGCRLQELSPVHRIGQIAPRGVFIVHGRLDQRILPQEGEALFQAAGEPKELWLLPKAEHVSSFYLYRQEYLSRAAQFFRGALGGKA